MLNYAAELFEFNADVIVFFDAVVKDPEVDSFYAVQGPICGAHGFWIEEDGEALGWRGIDF